MDVAVCGVDIGITGGIAIMEPTGVVWQTWPIPTKGKQVPNRRKPKTKKLPDGTTEEIKQSKYRIERSYDLSELIKIVNQAEEMARMGNLPTLWLVEHVTSMPRDGSTQAFKFGDCFGQMKGVLAATVGEFELVRPHEWTKKVIPDRKSKKDHKAAAEPILQRSGIVEKISEGEIDAVLIAEYGRRVCEARERASESMYPM